jgi:cytoskeletal protein RodZ
MFHLSDSIYRNGSGGGMSTAHSTFLDSLNRPSKFILASLVVLLLAFFVLWISPSTGNKFVKATEGVSSQDNTTSAIGSATVPAQNRSQNYVGSTTKSSASTNPGNSQGPSNKASVNVNGQSVSATTDSNNPSANVNKTIITDGGTATVSIQSNVNNDAQSGQASSSQNVQFNSNVRGVRDTHIHIEQNSSGGGSMP